MIITLTGPQIASLVFHLIIVISMMVIARKTWVLLQFKKGLIAAAKAVPIPPSPKLINQWLHEYESPATSEPRRAAYKKRLIEVGMLDEDGKKIKHGD